MDSGRSWAEISDLNNKTLVTADTCQGPGDENVFGIPVHVAEVPQKPSCLQTVSRHAMMSITERAGISSVSGTDTVISSGVNSVESGTPLCAVKMGTTNHGCSPRAKVPALQSMTAPCFYQKVGS